MVFHKVSKKCQECLKKLSRVFKDSFMGVSRKIERHLKEVFKGGSRMLKRSLEIC